MQLWTVPHEVGQNSSKHLLSPRHQGEHGVHFMTTCTALLCSLAPRHARDLYSSSSSSTSALTLKNLSQGRKGNQLGAPSSQQRFATHLISKPCLLVATTRSQSRSWDRFRNRFERYLR